MKLQEKKGLVYLAGDTSKLWYMYGGLVGVELGDLGLIESNNLYEV